MDLWDAECIFGSQNTQVILGREEGKGEGGEGGGGEGGGGGLV